MYLGPDFRVYTNSDIIGVEMGAAKKYHCSSCG